MTAGWQSVRLGTVARIHHGWPFAGSAMDTEPSGSPVVVGIGNLDYSGGFRFATTTVKRYLGEYPAEYELEPGDTLLAMTCQTPGGEILGIPGTIPDDGETYLHNQRLGKVDVVDQEALHAPYVFQLARWSEFNRHLVTTASGSKILHTSPGRIEDFEFGLPPIAEQRAIAATLGALDDKIESNRRAVAVIPALIRAAVTSALGEGPSEAPVSELGSFVNGGAYTKGASGAGRVVIRIADLRSGLGASTVYSDIDVPDDHTARPGDLLMSWSGSLNVYRWALAEAIINQHIFKVLPSSYPAWLVFDRLDFVMPEFQAIARDKATTMGHIQRGHLDSTTVPLPALQAIERLDTTLRPLWDRLLVTEQESARLAQLRDTLLPELLSGRVRVRLDAA